MATARTILSVSLPLLLGSLINVCIQFSNTYFMGHASADALYFVSLYIPISFFLLAIVEGISVTNQVVVAKKTGQNTLIEMPAVTYSLAVTGIVTLLFLALGSYVLGERVVPALFAMPPELGGKFVIFLTAMLATSALTIPGLLLDSTLRGMGRTGLAFLLLLGYGLFYIGTLYYLTQSLGMDHMAIPYAIAISSLVFLIATMFAVRAATRGHIPVLKLFFHPEAFIMLRYVGIPVGLSHVLIFISTFFYTRILAPFGIDVVSGFGVAFRIQTFIILPALTFGEGISILMNQRMGAGRAKESLSIFQVGLGLCFALYAFVSLSISLSGSYFPSLITSNPVVVTQAVAYLSAVAPTYCWMGVLLTLLLILEQTDNAFRAFALNFFYFASVIVVGQYLTQRWNDPQYFYKTIAYGNLVGLLIIGWEWRRQKQKFARMLDKPQVAAGFSPA